MSLPPPLTLREASVSIAGSPAIRVTSCQIQLHADGIELVPSRDSTDRTWLPTATWLSVILTIAASNTLQGLARLGAGFACTVSLGSETIDATEAHLIGYTIDLNASGVTETLDLRLERWTIGGGA